MRPTQVGLSDRSIGWLRYLHRKATTPDVWERTGRPHEHWDDTSEAPMLSWKRFDLSESTYALALMADRTPAWREVYTQLLDELIERHTGWWAAEDWLTQIGHDPDRESYPDLYRFLIPGELWGRYDVPGWTANGVAPWGFQPDPLAADGMLFFKGFFLVMLGLHLRVSGDTRWERPFDMIRDGEHTFTWHHSKIASYLAEQWATRPDGPHCENTKVWPLCLSAAGMGLRLHDTLRGTDHHAVVQRWLQDVCLPRYFGMADATAAPADLVTFYFDPLEDVHQLLPVAIAGAYPAYYLATQAPEAARTLFDAACRQSGLVGGSGPIGLPGCRMTAMLLLLAREWGMDELSSALAAAADEQYEPSWDAATGEHTWGFGYGEAHPRGQHNACMAAAEAASEGAWWRLVNETAGSRFEEPTVIGVDFPRVALREAWWDAADQRLHVELVQVGDATEPVSFRVEGLPPGTWVVDARHGPATIGDDARVDVVVGTGPVVVRRRR